MFRVTRWLILAFVLAALGLVLFKPGWENPFVLDDMTKIQQNPDVRLGDPRIGDFIYPYTAGQSILRNDPSRPLTYYIYNLCWRVGGGGTKPFHIVSTVVHTSSSFLLAVLTASLMGEFAIAGAFWGGAVAALMFLTAPVLAGSVFYAYALSDLLAALFLIVALLCRRHTFGVLVFFTLALASKQSAIAFPAVLMALAWLSGGWKKVRGQWVLWSLMLLACAFYLFLRAVYLGGIGDLEAQGTPDAFEYALSQGGMILKYLRMLLVPTGLTIDHFIRPEQLNFELEILQWLLVFGLTVLALLQGFRESSRNQARWLGLGWLVFLFLLLPVSSFLPTVDLFVERRAYLSGLGVFMGVGGGLGWGVVARSGWVRILVFGIIAAIVSSNLWLTRARASVYGSKQSLWEESLRRYPLSPRAHLNLATAWAEAGRYADARVLLEELRLLQPNNGVVYSKLGFIYAQPGFSEHENAKAWEYYRKSLELEPNDVIARLNAGPLLMQMGRFQEASAILLRAVELSPGLPYANFLLGQALAYSGNRLESIKYFEKVLELEPGNQDARRYLEEIKAR